MWKYSLIGMVQDRYVRWSRNTPMTRGHEDIKYAISCMSQVDEQNLDVYSRVHALATRLRGASSGKLLLRSLGNIRAG